MVCVAKNGLVVHGLKANFKHRSECHKIHEVIKPQPISVISLTYIAAIWKLILACGINVT